MSVGLAPLRCWYIFKIAERLGPCERAPDTFETDLTLDGREL